MKTILLMQTRNSVVRSLLFIILLFISLNSISQKNRNITAEIGGVGGFGSISYSKQFKSWENVGLEYRCGLSFVPIDRNNGNGFIFPVLVHATYGKNKHFADVGLGQALTVTTRGSVFLRMPTSFGYRYQTDTRIFYRIAYTPLISYIYNFQWEHWAGVSIGYKF